MSDYPRFENNGSGYNFYDRISGQLVKAEFGPLKTKSSGTKARVAVYLDGVPIIRSTPTLGSTSGVDAFWKKLERRKPAKDYGIDWESFIEEAIWRATDAHERGEPVVRISDTVITENIEWSAFPYVLENQASIIYGSGGSCKSMLALWIAALMDTGYVDTAHGVTAKKLKVLYLDWETDEEEVLRRLNWLHAGMGLEQESEILYRRCARPLTSEADHIKNVVEKEEVDVIMVDSLGLATGGGLDEAGEVLEYFQALRDIGRTSLTITHTNKEGKIFGSVYTVNSGRTVWELKSDSPEKGIVDVVTFHRKANIVQRMRPRGFQLKFNVEDDNPSVVVTTKEVMDTELAGKELSISNLVLHIIESEGPLPRLQIPEMVARYKEKAVEKIEGATATAISRHLSNTRLIQDGIDDLLMLPGQQPSPSQKEEAEWTSL